MTSEDINSVTFLQASVDGTLPSNLQDGLLIKKFGREVVHVNRLASQDDEREQPMNDTYGPHGSTSSASAALLQFLVSKLRVRLPLAGSMGLPMIWKEKTTLSQRVYYQLAASVRRTEGTGYGLLPTPVSSDATSGAILGKNDTYRVTKTGMPRKVNQNGKDGSVGLARLLKLQALLPTPTTSDAKGASAKRSLGSPFCHGNLREVLRTSTTDGEYPHPKFVAWMMGYTEEHLSSMHLAMRLYQPVRKPSLKAQKE
jgi:hypothetical protein